MKKIRLSQLYSASGTGLGYQISSYIMMRNLEGTTNRVWEVGNNSYKAFRNNQSYVLLFFKLNDNIGIITVGLHPRRIAPMELKTFL